MPLRMTDAASPDETTKAALVDPELINQRVLRARIRLSLQQPFLASALMRLPVRAVPDSDWCRTAATDGYHIFYNPKWVADLKDAELRGLLAHEVLHVLFTHADRRHDRDAVAWNMACDYAINYLLIQRGFDLPQGGLISQKAKGKTSEQIYTELVSEANRQEGAKSGKSSRIGKKAQRKPSGRPGKDDSSDSLEASDAVPEVGDDLIDPDDPRVRPVRSRDAPDREQMAELRRELRQEALARLSGTGAGGFLSECESDDSRRIDWRALMRAHLSERIKGDWTSFPFSKRLIHRGLFMPSPGLQVPGHVVFAIDTSGSMSVELLNQIVDELRAFREVFPCQLTVLQCDAEIRSVEECGAMDGYEIPANYKVHGRGGTSFCPVFDWVANTPGVALVLYATDGLGIFPKTQPNLPVIWLHTQSHSTPANFPFGAVVDIADHS
jgi:predicted metal-dependent peptidase